MLDAHLVPAEHAGDGRVDVELELQPLLLGLNPDHVDNLGKKRARLVGGVDNLHLSGLDFGDVQDVVDQGEQQLAGPLDVPGIFRHLWGDIAPQGDLVQADDSVDGGAYFVAHAGKEVVFRLIQFLNLLLLLLGEGVLLLIHPIQEHEQHAGEQSDHDHGEGGVEKGVLLAVQGGQLRVVEGDAVAEQRLGGAQDEKCGHAPAVQGDADVDKAEHKPLRHPAVKPARSKEGERKQGEQKYHYGCGPCMDASLLNTEPYDQ